MSLVCQNANAAVAQWLWILRRFTPQNDRRRRPFCHSERSEESRASDRLSAQVYPPGILLFHVQPVSLVCQNASAAAEHWLWILRRFTPQNDRRRAPSVILNGVKNPERPTAQRSGLSTRDSPILCTTRESRLSECKRSSRALALDSSSLHSSE